jgi:hypothetical protein
MKMEGGLTLTEAVQTSATLPDYLKSYEENYQATVREVDDEVRAELRTTLKVFRESYFAASSLIQGLVNRQPRPSPSNLTLSSTESKMTARIKLPTIALPSFNGNAEEWVSYRDTFISMVHNNKDLSGSTKFRYLKSSITDKLSPIVLMPESTERYEDAWETVKRFYENKRKIVDKHFASIFNMKRMTGESADELQRIINETRSNMAALQRMHSDEDLFQMVIANQVISRLDAHTRDLFETDKKQEIPAWQELKEFLEKRQKVLSTLPKPIKIDVPKPVHSRMSNAVAVEESMKLDQDSCPFCDDHHQPWVCNEFQAISIQDRWGKVKEANLCFNCLCSGHQTSLCPSHKRCQTCKKAHHSLLHRENVQRSMFTTSHRQEEEPITWNTQFSMSSTQHESVVLLSTAIIKVQGADGNWKQLRALLDNGSMANFVTEVLR